MSGPNTSYDPVEVAVLEPAGRRTRRSTRRSRRSPPPPTSTRSRRVRLEHAGDASPLALANREIGALPPAAEGGRPARRPGPRRRAQGPRRARGSELEAERDARVSSRRPSTSRCPPTAPARAPGTRSRPLTERIADVFVGDGLGGRGGPRGRGRVVQLRRAELRPRPPGARRCRTRSSSSRPSRGLVLRTHTSARCRSARCSSAASPIYVICPGKVFRTDELDATHTPVFHQVEGLAVDKGLTMAHLKGTLDHFARAMFGPGVRTRLRPSFFPFTEPSAELDVLCFVCAARTAAAAPARAPAGSSGAAAAWSTRTCCAPRASTPRSTRASPSAWASSAR